MFSMRKTLSLLTGIALFLQTSLPPLSDSSRFYAAARLLVSPYPLAQKDAIQQRCDELADPIYDSQKVGSGVRFDQINTSEALPVCQQAATRQTLRPHYQFLYGRVLDAAQRYSEASQQYYMAYQGGDGWGANGLARLYHTGQGVSQNLEQAVSLYRVAANAGVPPALFNLGILYEMGVGVPRDLNEALRWYVKAGDNGYPDGYAAAGWIYVKGNSKNYAEAAKWNQKAVQNGSALGYAMQGYWYQFGLGVSVDTPRAAQLYNTAAQKGSVEGMYLLGVLYLNGQGVRKDFATAASLFQQAARLGSFDAKDELGNMYLRGLGVTADPQVAFAWYSQAAQAGKADAQFWVAAMYDNGQGVAQNKPLAVAWYRKAAEQGDPFAMTQLGYHLREGQGVAWSEREAMQWFRQAADKGNVDAQTALGWGYMQGLGQSQGQGIQDYRQAYYWLSKAASQKDASAAQLNLGVLYQKGWGVDQDLAKANQLFRQAASSPYPEIANAAKTYVRNSQVATTKKSSDDTDALLGLAVLTLGVLAVGTLLSGPSSSHNQAPTTGTLPDTSNSNDASTQILQDHLASENAAREAAAAERQADRDNWARTQRCGFNANVNCF